MGAEYPEEFCECMDREDKGLQKVPDDAKGFLEELRGQELYLSVCKDCGAHWYAEERENE